MVKRWLQFAWKYSNVKTRMLEWCWFVTQPISGRPWSAHANCNLAPGQLQYVTQLRSCVESACRLLPGTAWRMHLWKKHLLAAYSTQVHAALTLDFVMLIPLYRLNQCAETAQAYADTCTQMHIHTCTQMHTILHGALQVIAHAPAFNVCTRQ